MSDTFVILVDSTDNQIGVSEKMEAHRKALLHRAVSVFICNTKGEWLLQRRALSKYHSNGLWTNTCCSHPHPNETSIYAANRRLMEEMGMECQLKEVFSFTYKEVLDNQLTEYEFDHVFIGTTDDSPKINLEEVMEWKYISFINLKNDIEQNPNHYTVWFKKIFERVKLHL
ncbi:MAG: isopentenyl-diphosphate Delta-isomerase [Tenuifilaceae bacterium]